MIQVEAMKEAVQLLQDAGFTRQDAIELLKVQAISNTCEVLDAGVRCLRLLKLEQEEIHRELELLSSDLSQLTESIAAMQDGTGAIRIRGTVTTYES